MARIRITRQLGGVQARATELVAKGQFAMANQVMADANLYAPMLSSDLRNQSQISADYKSITWNSPYARRHYYNQFVNYTTPGTGPKWDEKAKGIHMESWKRVIEVAMN